MRWKDWNTKPTFSPRSRARSSSLSEPRSTPSSQTRPEVGRSRPASRPSSVLLPLPDGPRMATNASGRHVERDTFQDGQLAPAGGEGLGQGLTAQHGPASLTRVAGQKLSAARAHPPIITVRRGRCLGWPRPWRLAALAGCGARRRPATAVARAGQPAGPSAAAAAAARRRPRRRHEPHRRPGPARSRTWPTRASCRSAIDAAGLPYRVVNAGVSGETSAGALRPHGLAAPAEGGRPRPGDGRQRRAARPGSRRHPREHRRHPRRAPPRSRRRRGWWCSG